MIHLLDGQLDFTSVCVKHERIRTGVDVNELAGRRIVSSVYALGTLTPLDGAVIAAVLVAPVGLGLGRVGSRGRRWSGGLSAPSDQDHSPHIRPDRRVLQSFRQARVGRARLGTKPGLLARLIVRRDFIPPRVFGAPFKAS